MFFLNWADNKQNDKERKDMKNIGDAKITGEDAKHLCPKCGAEMRKKHISRAGWCIEPRIKLVCINTKCGHTMAAN